MPNMDPKKCPMPSQDPNVRNKNFKEVALGYTAEMAVNEAKRCLQCKKPACRTGCPVQIDIPAFIAEVAKGDFEAAYQVIAKSSALPAVCGRVCPQENQCEGKCVRGIKGEPVGIGRLERFVADWHRENVHTPAAKPEPNGHKVAVIGAGPSGLTVAGDLAKLGYKVTVYEALHVAGGVLMYGIPEFRLPKDIVQHEVEGLKELGVDIECNMVIGKVLTVDELMNDYGFEAIYIASGAGLPRFMGIPGESLKGVYSANEYLTRVNLMKAYQPGSRTPIMKSRAVAVVGGGNVAMDAARCAKRLGAENYVFWGGREGYENLWNTQMKREQEHMAKFFHMCHDYAKEIGLDAQFLIEPKAKEPTMFQYDFDAATAINFLRTYDLMDVFKLNLEGNHANLAGHTYQHEIRTAREAGVLGSLDANQGDKLIGWDMDEFPTDLYETSTVMWEVLAEGQIGPHGGLNFDAKPRRTSFTAEDLFRSHIAGMDSFAAGLLVAAKMHEDKVIENLQAERYSSFDSGIGATVENGTASLASLEEYALDIPQAKLIEATKSDHLESVKATINNYMIDALAEA